MGMWGEGKEVNVLKHQQPPLTDHKIGESIGLRWLPSACKMAIEESNSIPDISFASGGKNQHSIHIRNGYSVK